MVDATLEASDPLFLSLRSAVEITITPAADLYIGGFLVAQDTTRYTERLPRGTHPIGVRHPVHGTLERQVEVESTAPMTVPFAFEAADSTSAN